MVPLQHCPLFQNITRSNIIFSYFWAGRPDTSKRIRVGGKVFLSTEKRALASPITVGGIACLVLLTGGRSLGVLGVLPVTTSSTTGGTCTIHWKTGWLSWHMCRTSPSGGQSQSDIPFPRPVLPFLGVNRGLDLLSKLLLKKENLFAAFSPLCGLH